MAPQSAIKPGRRYPTGAKPTPRHRYAMARRFEVAAPKHEGYARIAKELGYWYNNQFGCCVTTEQAAFCAAMGLKVTDAPFLQFCQANDLLNGAFLDENLDLFARTGFSQDGNVYGSGSKATVNYADYSTLCAAIEDGPVKLGVAAGQLDAVVQGQNGWFLLDARSDQDEDHAVGLHGYGTVGWLASQIGTVAPSGADANEDAALLFTWSTYGIISHKSIVAISGEAWLRSGNMRVVGTGKPNPETVDEVSTDDPTPTPAPTPTPTPTPTPGPITCFTASLSSLMSGVGFWATGTQLVECLFASGSITQDQRRTLHGMCVEMGDKSPEVLPAHLAKMADRVMRGVSPAAALVELYDDVMSGETRKPRGAYPPADNPRRSPRAGQ
ncbi:MAG TPA: hypothetical protein VH092_38375 [Urbifossiella sp.]|jgi:hypothetical protein|nr:hypothetical protein [Urbifossiella sp.]